MINVILQFHGLDLFNIKLSDIVSSVIFTQNEDLVVTYWNKESNQEVACPDQSISAENGFHLQPIFQDVIKPRRRRVYFRVVKQQLWRYSAKQNLTFILLC